jgi:anthranilate phosphoribosyltransferase
MPDDVPVPYPVREILESLLARRDLEARGAEEFMTAVIEGRVAPVSLSAVLVALRSKGETEAELAACAKVMRARAVPIRAPEEVLDTCGTGGDGAAVFNLSTAAALIAAGAGVPVAKHGNRSVSSSCGSADVLKELGVKIEAPAPVVERCLRETGFGFLFAPLFHPGMKHAAPVRRELGIRTLFNLLGPLANPARARRQLLGVFEPRWCEVFARALRTLGGVSAWVVCGPRPGGGWLDELSPWGPTTIARLEAGQVRLETFEPKNFGFSPPPAKALAVSGPRESAQRMRELLAGGSGPVRDAALLNSAAALQAAGRASDWETGLKLAAESLDSGRAQAALQSLISCSNRPE